MAHNISTGQPSTLGTYRDLSAIIFGANGEATRFLDEKIAKSPNGRDEEVIAEESQMLYLLATMEQNKPPSMDDLL